MTNAADSGAGTLRAAFDALANDHLGQTTPLTYRVVIDPGVNPVVTSDLLLRTKAAPFVTSLELRGQGKDATRITTSGIDTFALAGSFAEVTVSSLTLSGDTSSPAIQGDSDVAAYHLNEVTFQNYTSVELRGSESTEITGATVKNSALRVSGDTTVGATPSRVSITDSAFVDSALVLHEDRPAPSATWRSPWPRWT